MPTCVTREDFEARMRVLAGEKAVTRHFLEQTHRNGEDLTAAKSELGTAKSRVDHIARELAVVEGVLTTTRRS